MSDFDRHRDAGPVRDCDCRECAIDERDRLAARNEYIEQLNRNQFATIAARDAEIAEASRLLDLAREHLPICTLRDVVSAWLAKNGGAR